MIKGSYNAQEGSEEEEDEGDVSNDDVIEEGDDETWFGMGMTRAEKIEERRSGRNNLIIKLVGRTIGYQYLWKQIQAMWRTESEFMLIDLSNHFYIIKLYRREEYERALLDGPWMIGDNYLHVQRWKPNFIADGVEISSLSVWIRFPVLPVEYYTKGWLKRAENSIGRTIMVDVVSLLASRGKFTCVCVEVDCQRPLKSGYHMHGDF